MQVIRINERMADVTLDSGAKYSVVLNADVLEDDKFNGECVWNDAALIEGNASLQILGYELLDYGYYEAAAEIADAILDTKLAERAQRGLERECAVDFIDDRSQWLRYKNGRI